MNFHTRTSLQLLLQRMPHWLLELIQRAHVHHLEHRQIVAIADSLAGAHSHDLDDIAVPYGARHIIESRRNREQLRLQFLALR